jgi:hypothetical protein
MLPEGFFDRVVRDGADAVVYADAEGKIRFWNASATRALRRELAALKASAGKT